MGPSGGLSVPTKDTIAAGAAQVTYGATPNSHQASPGWIRPARHFHELETRFKELSVLRKKTHATRIPGVGKGLRKRFNQWRRDPLQLYSVPP